jgi:hypothetical protein
MVLIRSIIEIIVTASDPSGACWPLGLDSDEACSKSDFASPRMTKQPALGIDADQRQPESRCISVRNLHPDLVASLGRDPQVDRLLHSVLRVKVIGPEVIGPDDLPDVSGRFQVLEDRVRFVPHFPFDSGIRFRASFEPRPLGRSELSEMLTLEFSFPKVTSAPPTQVQHVFPSSDSLPENLLRFYVRFSNSMQRGRSAENIVLLGPDGRPAPDTLYRAPVELWDRSMRHLTILLDPGRLKRGVGPNRDLGPPLKAGQEYTLAIGSGMVDCFGRPLHQSFHKSFHVTEAIREPIAVEQWAILPPATNGHQPLALMFPRPLDWALLGHAITIESKDGQPINGRIAIDQGERRWTFTPASPWIAGSYRVRIALSLEDVCGNGLLGAFDRPLRSASDLAIDVANRSLSFHLA